MTRLENLQSLKDNGFNDGVYVLNIGPFVLLVRLLDGEVFDLGFQDDQLKAGDIFAARVLSTLKLQAFVEGVGGAYFLCDLGSKVKEGDLIPVRLKTPALQDKPGRCILLKDFKEPIGKAGQILHSVPRAEVVFAHKYPQDSWLTNDPDYLNRIPGIVLKSDFDVLFFLKNFIDPLRANPYPLDGGGFLIVEPGHTLTAIDVNTKPLNLAGQESFLNSNMANLYEFNLNAAPEIARLIKILKLGGLIIVDFPRLTDFHQKEDLKKKMRLFLKGTDIQVLGFTKGGLMELIAPRLEPTLFQRF